MVRGDVTGESGSVSAYAALRQARRAPERAGGAGPAFPSPAALSERMEVVTMETSARASWVGVAATATLATLASLGPAPRPAAAQSWPVEPLQPAPRRTGAPAGVSAQQRWRHLRLAYRVRRAGDVRLQPASLGRRRAAAPGRATPARQRGRGGHSDQLARRLVPWSRTSILSDRAGTGMERRSGPPARSAPAGPVSNAAYAEDASRLRAVTSHVPSPPRRPGRVQRGRRPPPAAAPRRPEG